MVPLSFANGIVLSISIEESSVQKIERKSVTKVDKGKTTAVVKTIGPATPLVGDVTKVRPRLVENSQRGRSVRGPHACGVTFINRLGGLRSRPVRCGGAG